ncbi:MAG: rRNA maturation RNase YbeY [Candidatus Omnitrophica bacterium]|nr:rRNA maturation RNase YbeY [Candidatus Omnitrophota bacterium]
MQIIIKNLQKKIPLSLKEIKEVVRGVLSYKKALKKSGEITILFVDDKQIREFNLFYRGEDYPTDVLSFDNSLDKKYLCVDIIISTETALRNARIFKVTSASELYRYIIHGLLHIFGYNDNDRKSKLCMQKEEDFLLRSLINP